MAKTRAHLLQFMLIMCLLNAPNIGIIINVSLLVQQSHFKLARPSYDSGNFESSILTLDYTREYDEEKALIINASDYLDGSDTERLQAALNDVPFEGATVVIPSGTWSACGLIAKSRTTVVGSNGSLISRPDSTTAPFLIFENCSNFAVSGLVFDGKETENACGILIRDGESFKIDHCVFKNVRKNAVKVTASLNGVCENFTIDCNLFMNCNDAPILLFGIPAKRAVRCYMIRNNTLADGTANGKIATAFTADGFILNNTLLNCEFGIATRCVSKTTISGNLIQNATSHGVYLGTQLGDPGTDNVLIENNLITGSDTGISRYYGSHPISKVVIEKNRFINNTSYDILADFPATYINNTITSDAKLAIKDIETVFIETRTVRNELVLPGDRNSDLKIDIRDISLIAKRLGLQEESPDWDAKADVINDGVIDNKDVLYVSRNYGFIA